MTLNQIRQPQPVEVLFIGEGPDIEKYRSILKRYIEGTSLDNAEPKGPDRLVIYPAAVND